MVMTMIDGRIGHIWGDRYWSEILEGEPPGPEEGGKIGVRPRREGDEREPRFSSFFTFFPLIFPLPAAPPPG
jgi:hypothetical protein